MPKSEPAIKQRMQAKRMLGLDPAGVESRVELLPDHDILRRVSEQRYEDANRAGMIREMELFIGAQHYWTSLAHAIQIWNETRRASHMDQRNVEWKELCSAQEEKPSNCDDTAARPKQQSEQCGARKRN